MLREYNDTMETLMLLEYRGISNENKYLSFIDFNDTQLFWGYFMPRG